LILTTVTHLFAIKFINLALTTLLTTMKQDEILLAEHRELVELYKHNWTNIFYLGVSYVVCNGALASLLGIIF
jgi:hypothetical protein